MHHSRFLAEPNLTRRQVQKMNVVNSTASSIDQIHKTLNDVNSQLSRVSQRLESEYSRLHARSPSHTNGYNAALRIQGIANDLPDLEQTILKRHSEQGELRHFIKQHLRTSSCFAQVAKTHISSSQDASSCASLLERLAHVNNGLRLFADQLPTRNNLTPRNQDENVPTDHMRVTSPSTASVTPVITPKNQEPTPRAVKSPSSGPKQKKTAKNENGPSTSPAFEPITKAVFNRLPRNLKIRAGKLPEVNKFYETVFNILNSTDGGSLSDKKLMQATGEDSTQRFEVLRGLAVLRSGKQGWTLAAKKV